MTIKNQNKNVSAEYDENIVTNLTLSNGILTVTRKNLYYEEEDDNTETYQIDLAKHRLKIQKINDYEDLEFLKNSSAAQIVEKLAQDYNIELTEEEADLFKESYIFLIPFANDDGTLQEGVYKEYIWVDEKNDFEALGSTKIDLEPYIQKTDVYNGTDYTEPGKVLDARVGKTLYTYMNDIATGFSNTLDGISKSFSDTLNNNIESLHRNINSDLNQKEDKINKVTSISNNSTNARYPSAKAVYDFANNKEDKSNKVTSISSNPTDIQYPSAKAVYDFANNKEDKSNKVTVISENSTDIEYPSALAVYNALQNAGGGLKEEDISEALKIIEQHTCSSGYLLCVKIISDSGNSNDMYQDMNILITEDDTGFYYYDADKKKVWCNYFYYDGFYQNNTNYSVYIVNTNIDVTDENNRKFIGHINLTDKIYTVGSTTFQIESDIILMKVNMSDLKSEQVIDNPERPNR